MYIQTYIFSFIVAVPSGIINIFIFCHSNSCCACRIAGFVCPVASRVLSTTRGISAASSTTLPTVVADWTSPVLTPPPHDADPKACFVYDVDTRNVSRISAKLLLLKVDDAEKTIDLMTLHRGTNSLAEIQIQLNDVRLYQVMNFREIFFGRPLC
jgi:hypothetical protein